MGATTFITRSKGETPAAAFKAARDKALYMHGHGGYTGTIAEKDSFVMIKLPADVKPEDHAVALINADDSRISDKWGPAGCIDTGGGSFVFFGWASE